MSETVGLVVCAFPSEAGKKAGFRDDFSENGKIQKMSHPGSLDLPVRRVF